MFRLSQVIKTNRLNKLYKKALINPSSSNQVWQLDFSSETLWNGLRANFIVISDAFDQKIVMVEAMDHSTVSGVLVTQMLERLDKIKQMPYLLVYDHSMFISNALDKWSKNKNIKQLYLHSGRSINNGGFLRLVGRRFESVMTPLQAMHHNFKAY